MLRRGEVGEERGEDKALALAPVPLEVEDRRLVEPRRDGVAAAPKVRVAAPLEPLRRGLDLLRRGAALGGGRGPPLGKNQPKLVLTRRLRRAVAALEAERAPPRRLAEHGASEAQRSRRRRCFEIHIATLDVAARDDDGFWRHRGERPLPACIGQRVGERLDSAIQLSRCAASVDQQQPAKVRVAVPPTSDHHPLLQLTVPVAHRICQPHQQRVARRRALLRKPDHTAPVD